MKANDIFISYSTKNSDIARAIRKLFQDHGITCWMAPESIPAGSNYSISWFTHTESSDAFDKISTATLE